MLKDERTPRFCEKCGEKIEYYYGTKKLCNNCKRERRNKFNKQKQNQQEIIRIRLRSLIKNAIRIYIKTGKIIGSKKYEINYKTIIKHLIPFPKNMKEYHIDHIKPLCTFDLTNPEEIKKAFAPENHQWLTIQENLRKPKTKYKYNRFINTKNQN